MKKQVIKHIARIHRPIKETEKVMPIEEKEISLDTQDEETETAVSKKKNNKKINIEEND